MFTMYMFTNVVYTLNVAYMNMHFVARLNNARPARATSGAYLGV